MREDSENWVKSSAISALAAMGLTAAVLYVPPSRALIVLGIGVVVFLLVLFRNPRYWYRRTAATVISVWAVTSSAPFLEAAFTWSENSFVHVVAGQVDIAFHTHVTLILMVLVAADVFIQKDNRTHRRRDQRARISNVRGENVTINVSQNMAVSEKAQVPHQAIIGRQSSNEVGTDRTQRIWNVPFAKNSAFTGRRKTLTRLQSHFANTERGQIQAIGGLGGVGKTQVAVEYCYRVEKDYKAILWVQADTEDDLVTDFARLTRVLNLPESERKELAAQVEAVTRWLENESNWLLVFDNADAPEIVVEVLPFRHSGHILITSRANDFQVLQINVTVHRFRLSMDWEAEGFQIREGLQPVSGRSDGAVRPSKNAEIAS